MAVRLVELFGGIGAPLKALLNLGLDVMPVDYIENDEKPVMSYNSMFELVLKRKPRDVRDYRLKIHVLVHGSPCQDISIAGRQKGADPNSGTRSSLMWETLEIIRQMGPCKPDVVIWENVKNVLSKTMRHNFEAYLAEMESMGYVNSYALLDTREFGLPQNRQRVWTVSILGGPAFDFSKLKKTPMRPLSEFLESDYGDQHIVKQPSVLSKIGSTDHKSFKGFVPVATDQAQTITCKQMRVPNSGVIPISHNRFRYFTERECWRLQGFDDVDFDKALLANPSRPGCQNGALYKQAGNSMPVPVLEAIFREVYAA